MDGLMGNSCFISVCLFEYLDLIVQFAQLRDAASKKDAEIECL
jgi:hypothetical protein